jgi:hypothetical protein
MLTREQTTQFNEIWDQLGKNLDISETDYNNAVQSYNAVGEWLCRDDSVLAPYNPEVLPQGSFILGTMIKPVNPKDDLDVDLACQLSGKKSNWAQKDLKNIVGDRIRDHGLYKDMLDEEGRRCWTLRYRENSDNFDKYHMDILPSIVSHGYKQLMERSLSAVGDNYNELSIRITDKHLLNYDWDTDINRWLLSNPFGYAKWFYNRAQLASSKSYSLKEAVGKFPKYQKERLPLQRVVQILKRHRDIMFDGDCDKPISVIITTLAAHAYQKQSDISLALVDVVSIMKNFIEERYDYVSGRWYKFIGNPANPEENFADKWKDNPNKQTNFYNWMDAVENDIKKITQQRGILVKEEMSRSFGENEVRKTFNNIGNNTRILTEHGGTRFDTKIGITSAATNIIKPHTFFGKE